MLVWSFPEDKGPTPYTVHEIALVGINQRWLTATSVHLQRRHLPLRTPKDQNKSYDSNGRPGATGDLGDPKNFVPATQEYFRAFVDPTRIDPCSMDGEKEIRS